VEPRFTSGVIVLGFDRFVVDVREVATESRNLLHEPALRVDHQFPIALIPQLVTMRDRSSNVAAVRLDGVFRYEFRCEWRQFPMPVNNLGPVVVDRGVHVDTSASSNRTTRLQCAGALTGEKRVRCVRDDSLRTRTAMRAFHAEEVGRMLSLEQEKCLGGVGRRAARRNRSCNRLRTIPRSGWNIAQMNEARRRLHDGVSGFEVSFQSTGTNRPASAIGARNVFLACPAAASNTA